MKVFYVRVSSQDQNEQSQVEIAKQNNADKIFIDKSSGKSAERPELEKMLNFVREGDQVWVREISRLGRNIRDLLRIVGFLKDKGVEFHSLKENIDTTTSTGRFTLTLFGALAEMERETILSNQKEGIALAKKLGKYKGRPPKKIDIERFKLRCSQWQRNEKTLNEITKEFGITLTTFFRWTKKFGIKKRK